VWYHSGDVQLSAGIISEVYKEERDSSDFRCLVIGYELGEWQPFRPVILKIVLIYSEVLFHYDIDLFSLAVHLRMERSREVRLNSQAYAVAVPKYRGELRSSI
jgi:hypothetical protein